MISMGTSVLPPSQLRIDHDKYKNDSIIYKNECDKLNVLVQQKDSEINIYKNQLSISNSQLSSVNSTNNSFRSKEQQLNTELQNKNNIINNFNIKEQQFVSKIRLLEGSNILLLQQIDGLQLDKKDLRTDKVKLNEEIEILKTTILKKDLLIEEQSKEIERLKKDNLEISFKNELFINETVKSILPGDIAESFLNNDVEENKSYSFL